MVRVSRFVTAALGVITVAALIIGALTFNTFHSAIRRIDHDTLIRMRAAAEALADRIAAHENAGSGDIATILEESSRLSGFARILLCDSLGIVHASTHPLIARGDDARPFVVDTAQFSYAAAQRAWGVSGRVVIGGESFQSLYYPLDLGGERFVIALDANLEMLATVRKLNRGMIAAVALLACALAMSAWLLCIIDHRARRAWAAAQHNERLAFLGQTSAELAHELKNPLAIMKSSVDILKRTYDPDSSDRAFRFLSDEIMRLSRFIGDILGLSSHYAPARNPFNARNALDGVWERLTQDFTAAILENQVDEQLQLTGDTDAFFRILSNLLRNAFQAGTGAVRITVASRVEGACCVLDIHDNGPGIDPALARRLFEPFVSGHRTGTGLGLAIVKTLCEKSGWTIRLTRHTPGDTMFTITVPEGSWHMCS